jgi:hypothetical protein
VTFIPELALVRDDAFADLGDDLDIRVIVKPETRMRGDFIVIHDIEMPTGPWPELP